MKNLLAQIDIKWWFEQPLRNQSLDEIETKEAIDSLLLIHDPLMTQVKGQPTNIQRNLYQEKEKEQSTCREPSPFE